MIRETTTVLSSSVAPLSSTHNSICPKPHSSHVATRTLGSSIHRQLRVRASDVPAYTVAPYSSQQHEAHWSTTGKSEHHIPAQVMTGPRRRAAPLRNLWAGARGTARQSRHPGIAVGPWVLSTLQAWMLSSRGRGCYVVMMLLWAHF